MGLGMSMQDFKTALRAERRRNRGVLAGLLGCIFAVLGIFTLGTLFVPIAALCTIVGLLRSAGVSMTGFAVSALGLFLSAAALVFSPNLVIALGVLYAA